MNSDVYARLSLALAEIGAIKFGEFRLKLHEKTPDAPLSPIYIDLRLLRSYPLMMNLAVEAYRGLTEGLQFDVYADVPTAATPLVAVLSHETGIPMISPRKESKGHGMAGSVDGVFKPGQVALLVDDLITTAESKLEAISALEQNGLIVHDVAVLVDREQGGMRELQRRGYACRAAIGLSALLTLYREQGIIDEGQYQRTLGYLATSS